MKKILFYLIIVGLFTINCLETKAYILADVHVIGYIWTDWYGCGEPPCQQTGTQCCIVVQNATPSIIGSIGPAGGGLQGRILTFPINDQLELHTPNQELGSPYNYTVSKANRLFKAGETIEINECTEDETLNGLTIDLEGKMTDGNGKFYYYIPY